MWRLLIAAVVLSALLAEPGMGHATVPGEPGLLVLSSTNTETGESDLFSIRSDGTGLTQITDNPAAEREPVLSPRGRHVAYAIADRDRSVVEVLDLRTGSTFEVFEYPAPTSVSGLAWAPDSEWLAIGVEARAGLGDVALVPLAGGEPRHVISTDTGEVGPSVDWSPLGDQLAITLDPTGEGPVIATVGLDGSNLTVLADGTSPSWSPDGSEIVFGGHGGTSVIRSDGSGLRVIPGLEIGEPPGAQLGVGFYPVWAPSGEQVAVIAFQGVEALVVDVVTGEAQVLPTEGLNAIHDIDWAPAAGPGTFADVTDTNVFFEDVEWLYREAITKGCNPPLNDLYCVGDTTTRGQVAGFLARAFDLGGVPGSNRFGDDDDSVFERDIEAMAANGITLGCNPPVNDRFCPLQTTTRGNIAAFMARALGLQPSNSDWFIDDDTSEFESEINAIADAAITRGCTPTHDRFCPLDSLTRGQIAALLHRADPGTQ